jgi:hypothetical protein
MIITEGFVSVEQLIVIAWHVRSYYNASDF